MEKRCSICDTQIEGIYQKLFHDRTKQCKVLLYEVIEQILKRDLVKEDDKLACYSCINRINRYEFGMWLKTQMENEILDTIYNTEKKYEFLISKIEIKQEQMQSTEDTEFVEIKDENEDSDYVEFIGNHWECNEEDLIERVNEDSVTESNQDEIIETICATEIIQDENSFIETVPVNTQSFKYTLTEMEEKYSCNDCDLIFSSASEIEHHKNTEHGTNESTNNQGLHICDQCGINYESRSKLNNHKRLHQEPIKCTICNKNFTQKGALKRHMAIHTGEKAYQCDICGKQFIHSSSFHMHNLAHGNIRVETCDICGYKLRSRSHLNRHMLIHTGEKKHECPICGQRFAQRYNMNVHIKLHSGIKRSKSSSKYMCMACDTKFKTIKSLDEHNREFHNDASTNVDRGDKEVLQQFDHLIEDQSEIYDNSNIMDVYNNENVTVELLL